MPSKTPTEVVNDLVHAINHGDIDAALALYEPNAVLIAQPGQIARGTEQLRTALGGFVALKANLQSEAQWVMEAGDVALYLGRWQLRGVDPSGKPVHMSGVSSDVLRRHAKGRWLVAVDNPWGVQIMNGA
ncbi:MAG TPA: nuclear transport factor 2 family protein [Gemmatimonadaceae bacterium]|nr:nuclear transport factor 2 family protein [Gemmatimonadaceae bacterium]